MRLRDLFFSKKVNKEVRSSESVGSSWFGGSLMFNGQSSYHQNKAMMHSVIFRCVDLLSNSIAQLPIVVNKVGADGYKQSDNQHVIFSMLNRRPNKRQDKNTFLRGIVMNMLLTGNGYARIIRNEGQITELQFIPSDMVTVNAQDIFSEPYYLVSGIRQPVASSEMLHFKNIVDRDGIRGISTIKYATKVLTLGFDELDTADAFFRSGNNKAGILKSDRPLTDEQTNQILSSWQQTFNGTNGTNNGVCVLKPGLSYESIQTSPQDAELLESRKFSIQEIARFFGVPLSMLLDNSNNSYSSVEAENLAFLTNTLAPLLDRIETELNNKLWSEAEVLQGYQVKFDSSVLLRTDKAALAEYYTKLFNLSVLSPNEIRRDLDLSPIEGGDNHFMQVNISTIDKISAQELSDNNTISNQLKEDEEGK